MSSGADALTAMIASLGKMQTLVADSMSALTAACRTEMQRTIAAGTDAEGKRWQPTQQGQQPLQHAAGAMSVMSVNKTIYITLGGVEARHHYGYVKGGRKRAIIPEEKIPDAMADAMRVVLQRAFSDAVAQ